MARSRKRDRSTSTNRPVPALAQAREPRGGTLALRAMAIVLTLLGIIPAANYITTGVGLPWWSSSVKQWLTWGIGIAIVAALLGRTLTDRVESAFTWAERALVAPSPRVFGAAIFTVASLLALYFGWRLFALQPVVGDEFAQRWQAHLLASGHLSAVGDPYPEFFSTIQTLEVRGRVFSQFPVGGPALLAIGLLVGVPWLVNPLLAGVAAVALYDFVASISDELTARVSAMLFALCPFVLFMSGSEMNHAGTLACVTIALAALARWARSADAAGARWPAVAMGVSLGAAATIRPFDAAVVALAIGIFQLVTIKGKPWLLRSLIAQCIAGAVPVALLFAANAATVGQPFTFAYDALNGPEHRPGFHMTPLGFEHTPKRGLYIISAYLMKLDIGLFGWPVPAMLVLVATLAFQRRATRWDYLLLAMLGGLMIGYGAYWSESNFVGPRFLYAALPVFVFYTARMTPVVRERIGAPWLRTAALLLVPLWLVAAWLIPPTNDQLFGTKRLAQMYTMPSAIPAIHDAVKSAGLRNAVVFLDEGWHSRLAARLRALGMRPLAAEQVVASADACNLQHALDAADRLEPSRSGERLGLVMSAVGSDAPASPLGQQVPNEQIAVVPGRAIADDCRGEAARIMSRGVSLAAMLPYVDLDADGKLGGNVVYARDFGVRNSLLQARYGNRVWYAARASFVDMKVRIALERIR